MDFKKIFIPEKGDEKTTIVRKSIILAAVGVFAVCLVSVIVYIARPAETPPIAVTETTTINVITTQTTTAPPETTAETTTTRPPLVTDEEKYGEFLEKNPDTAGWIKVSDIVDQVVLQTTDNEKYLDKDFNLNYNIGGSVYIDYRCNVLDYADLVSDNIVIYGHNQRDGTAFGKLKNYKVTKANSRNIEYYKKNPTFEFSNLYETHTYKIVSIYVIEVEPRQNPRGEIFDYHNYIQFNRVKQEPYTYATWESQILAHSAIDTGVDIEKGDKFVTLSTCSNEFDPSRFVIIGRRVRDGESPEVDTSKAVLNEDAIEPDWAYIYNNS
ncbi:MAG: class B sortase [Ruminococcus sp.]|jgi:SrtB family sortase|nr:class B sortase [Ruminococcus sp.]